MMDTHTLNDWTKAKLRQNERNRKAFTQGAEAARRGDPPEPDCALVVQQHWLKGFWHVAGDIDLKKRADAEEAAGVTIPQELIEDRKRLLGSA